MARVKRTWRALISRMPMTCFQHMYTNGVSTGGSFRVRFVVVVTEGPEAGREVEVSIPAREARQLSRMLLEKACDAEKMNDRDGYRDGA